MNILPIDNTLFINNQKDNLSSGVDIIQVEDFFYYKLDNNLMLQFDNENELRDLKFIKGDINIYKLNKLKSDINSSYNIPEENVIGNSIVGPYKEIW